MSKIIEIYTDGSAGPTNPGPGGFGVIVISRGLHMSSIIIGRKMKNRIIELAKKCGADAVEFWKY